jgi:hypothetical protein
MSPINSLLLALAAHYETQPASSPLPSDFLRMLEAMPAKELAQAVITLTERFVDVTKATREHMLILATVDFNMHPHQAEKLNLPTLAGSLMGLTLPKVDESKICGTCAFRQGSAANQSVPTVSDLKDCLDLESGKPFMCHEDLSKGDQPTKVCRGYAQAMLLQKKA